MDWMKFPMGQRNVMLKSREWLSIAFSQPKCGDVKGSDEILSWTVRVSGWGGFTEDIISSKEGKFLGGQVVE